MTTDFVVCKEKKTEEKSSSSVSEFLFKAGFSDPRIPHVFHDR